jgi:hypothetical protein
MQIYGMEIFYSYAPLFWKLMIAGGKTIEIKISTGNAST